MVKPSASYTKPVLEDVETGDGKQLKASGRCAACRVRNPGKTRSAFTLSIAATASVTGKLWCSLGSERKAASWGLLQGCVCPLS